MSDLISRDDAITAMLKEGEVDMEAYGCWIPECFDGNRAASVISYLPTIDAVEVVHCRDCIWRLGTECTRFAEVPVMNEDYCSRGERKHNGKE